MFFSHYALFPFLRVITLLLAEILEQSLFTAQTCIFPHAETHERSTSLLPLVHQQCRPINTTANGVKQLLQLLVVYLLSLLNQHSWTKLESKFTMQRLFLIHYQIYNSKHRRNWRWKEPSTLSNVFSCQSKTACCRQPGNILGSQAAFSEISARI